MCFVHLYFLQPPQCIFHTATINRRGVSKMEVWSSCHFTAKTLLGPFGCSPLQLLVLRSSPAICSSYFELHVVSACVWSSLSFLRLPGWLHPLSRSPSASIWLIPVGYFQKSMSNQINLGPIPLLHHSAYCALFRFSVSPLTGLFTSCLLHLCTSQLRVLLTIYRSW